MLLNVHATGRIFLLPCPSGQLLRGATSQTASLNEAQNSFSSVNDTIVSTVKQGPACSMSGHTANMIHLLFF